MPPFSTISACLAFAIDEKGDPVDRMDAIEILIAEGLFDAALPVATQLQDVQQTKARARRAATACKQYKRWGIKDQLEPFRGFGRVAEDPLSLPIGQANSVAIARRGASQGCIVVFIGAAGHYWTTAYLLYGILPQDHTVIFLRDPYGASYLAGLDVFELGYRTMEEGLLRLIAELGCDTFYTMGECSGGFAAIYFGVTRGARRVLACSPSTVVDHLIDAYRTQENASLLDELMPDTLDLAELLATLSAPPPIMLVFGGANEADSFASRRLAGVPGVNLYEIPGYERHDVVPHLLATGQLKTLVAELVQA